MMPIGKRDRGHDHRPGRRADDALGDAGLGRVARQVGGQEVEPALREDRQRPVELRPTSSVQQDASENSRRRAAARGEHHAADVAPRAPAERCGLTAMTVDGWWSSARSSSVCRVRRTNAVADDVEAEGHQEQQQAEEEQALERRVVAGRPGRCRRPARPSRRSSSGPGPSGFEREQRAAAARRPRAPRPSSRRSPREMARIIAATMPEIAAGTTTRRRVVTRARAEAVRRLAQRSRHRPHRVLGDRRDERDGQDARRRCRPPAG